MGVRASAAMWFALACPEERSGRCGQHQHVVRPRRHVHPRAAGKGSQRLAFEESRAANRCGQCCSIFVVQSRKPRDGAGAVRIWRLQHDWLGQLAAIKGRSNKVDAGLSDFLARLKPAVFTVCHHQA